MNTVTLVGNISSVTARKTQTGKSVVNIRLATDRRYRGSDGEQKKLTDWHTVTCWDRLATMAMEHLAVGDYVCIQATLRPRSYERDGSTEYVNDVVATGLFKGLPLPPRGPRTDQVPPPSDDDLDSF